LDKAEKRNAPALERLSLLLRDAGVVPGVRLTDLDGQPVGDCSTYVFNAGTTKLVGLVPDYWKPTSQKLHLTFEQAVTVYDVRRKQHLGSGNRFEVTVEPAAPRLFAVLSAPVAELLLKTPGKARLGEEIQVAFEVLGVRGLRSVAKVVVTDPQGKSVSFYGCNCDILDGKGRASFRSALNDPAGRWRVAVTEVISGKRAIAEIQIGD
jgi:hypothetical protein